MTRVSFSFVVVIIVTLLIGGLCIEGVQEDVYEDGYYDDTYEEESSVVVQIANDGGNVISEQPAIEEEALFGFYRNVGGGVVKINKRIATDTYINDSMTMYDCVKKVDAHILVVELVDEEDEEEEDVAKQVMDLRRRMEKVTSMAAGISNGTVETIINSNVTANVTVVKKEKEKKVSFREKQEIKMRERRERELLKEKIRPKFRVGADCESLVCGACKSVVEEFGRAVHAVVDDKQYRYVEDVMKGFCKSKGVALKYVDMVGDICTKFEQDSLGYKESLVAAYEVLPDGSTWKDVKNWDNLNAKKKQVCLDVGACTSEDFRFQTKAELRIQEQWDEKCFTCQAFARDLETKVQLTRQVTEGSIVSIVAETCNRLDLEPHYKKVCEPLVNGKLLDDIAWLAKVHGEAIDRKTKGEARFPDKLCEEIDWCVPWVDPVKLREKQAQASMEAVFF